MSQSLVVRRERNRVVIEEVVNTPDYKGVLKANFLAPEDAISLFEAGLRMARQILAERRRDDRR